MANETAMPTENFQRKIAICSTCRLDDVNMGDIKVNPRDNRIYSYKGETYLVLNVWESTNQYNLCFGIHEGVSRFRQVWQYMGQDAYLYVYRLFQPTT